MRQNICCPEYRGFYFVFQGIHFYRGSTLLWVMEWWAPVKGVHILGEYTLLCCNYGNKRFAMFQSELKKSCSCSILNTVVFAFQGVHIKGFHCIVCTGVKGTVRGIVM